MQKSRFLFCKILHLLVKAFEKIYIASFTFHWYTFLQKFRLLVLVKFFYKLCKYVNSSNWDLNSQSKASVVFQNLQRYASLHLQRHACLHLQRQACLCLLWKLGSNRNYSNYCSTATIGGETENLSWTQKPPTRFVIETFQLITLRFVGVTSRIWLVAEQ